MNLIRRHLLFGGYCAVVALANWSVLDALYQHSSVDHTASHVVLMPFVSVGLIILSRQRIFESVRTDARAAAAILAGGVGLAVATWPYRSDLGQDPALALVVGALIVLWIGGFVLFYGRTAARAALFPLLFLAFTMPFPKVVLEPANDFLKNGSTELVARLFTLSGTPYYREAYVFRLPAFVIEVADACSGIRSSIGLLITTLLAGYLFLATSWKKAALVLAIVPITLLKNAIRIVALSLLALHVDPSFLTGQLHHEGGIVFFVLALLLLAPVLLLLRRSEVPQPTAERAIHEAPAAGKSALTNRP
jgi:exosortase